LARPIRYIRLDPVHPPESRPSGTILRHDPPARSSGTILRHDPPARSSTALDPPQGLSPLDLLQAYDLDGSGSFSFKEFLVMMKKLVRPALHDIDVWDADVRPVVKDAFRAIAAGDGIIDVIEFGKWLNRGWLARKKALTGALAPADGAATSTAPSSATPSSATPPEADPAYPRPVDAAALPAGSTSERSGAHAGACRGPPTVAASRSAPALWRPEGRPGSAARAPLPEVSAAAKRLIGNDTKEYLQTLCRIAATGAGRVQRRGVEEAQRKHLRQMETQRAAVSSGRRRWDGV
jgi:hypothetical protein